VKFFDLSGKFEIIVILLLNLGPCTLCLTSFHLWNYAFISISFHARTPGRLPASSRGACKKGDWQSAAAVPFSVVAARNDMFNIYGSETVKNHNLLPFEKDGNV
jgi:hypothetical protein